MQEWTQGDYTISTDRERLNLATIQRYLSEEAYWAKGRPVEITRQVIEHSLCFGVYYNGAPNDKPSDKPSSEQIGFARVITDYATHAYVADLFIVPAHQGQGLGKWLVQCILAHPATEAVYKWALHTLDAHGLYAQFGFAEPSQPVLYMEIRKSPPWVATSL